LVATQVQAAFNIVSLAAGTFCSYTNDVARVPKNCQAVWQRKSPLPNKSSIALQSCLQTRQTASLGEARLARLYANGIFARVYRDVLQRNQRVGTSSMTQPTIRLTVNGRIHDVNADRDTALLYVLRNDLELNGPKYGCGLGECGACAVLIDGVAARSCVIPVSGCIDRDIVTLEGLGSRDHPDPVQEAFIAEQAAQCGYCLNGMIMSTKALLLRSPHPSEAELLEALRYNLCRCGAHIEIMRAAMRAAGALAEAQD
jgi:nicotinate dehydrogenase subunit A